MWRQENNGGRKGGKKIAEGKRAIKLVFFGDPSSLITTILFKEVVKVLKHRKDFLLTAVVDASKHELPHGLLQSSFGASLFKYLVVKFFNPTKRMSFNHYGSFLDLASRILPEQLIMHPPDRNINDHHFISRLKLLRPDLALSAACPQKFQRELLNVFTYCVNCHNGLLPKYRGICSTTFSVYYGEKVTGYTFHIMDEEFDSGNILAQGCVPIDHYSTEYLEIRKTIEAGKHLDEIIDCLLNKEEGSPQKGDKSYFGSKKHAELVTIDDLTSVDPEEIRRRLIAFNGVKVPFKGEKVYVTDIQDSRGHIRIKRIRYLPVWLWLICRRIGLLAR